MRLLAAFTLLSIVIVLCVYSGYRHPGVTLEECLASPAAYNGTVIYSPREATIGEVLDGGFVLQWEGKSIPVVGKSQNLKEGSYLQVKAVFHETGYLEALAIRMASYRRLKMAVSAVVVAIVLYIFFRHFGWDASQLAIKEK
jgi:hypothetical protein